jgi:hypothetical protein
MSDRDTNRVRRCDCTFVADNPAGHDQLLRQLNDEGVEGVVDLLGEVITWLDEDHPLGEDSIGPFDLRDFVGQHNFDRPALVWELAGYLTDAFEMHRALQQVVVPHG